MSGHSKWSTIKHKKAKEDSKRGKIFSRHDHGDPFLCLQKRSRTIPAAGALNNAIRCMEIAKGVSADAVRDTASDVRVTEIPVR